VVIKALNLGADAYIIKPFDVEAVLRTIREHLKKQHEAKTYNQEKVLEFIKTRARELETTTHQ
jgi:DNA-binding response OmpR family regulator